MEYDVIIVGAGASGLMAAITAARQGSSVLLIEQKEKAGKKILASGNGKCNFTNNYQAPECYRSDDSAFAMKVLSCFDVSETLSFFRELGIFPKERNGYYYPNSEQAASVVSVLMMECERLKVCFSYNEKVKEIQKPFYTILTEQVLNDITKDKKNVTSNYKIYHAKRLILATGGCASPKLGSDGSGYALAKSLGHSIIRPLPALVQLKSPDKYCKTISGVRVEAEVTAFSNSGKIAYEAGEILFTDYGISGIPILQISRFVAKALDKGEKVRLVIDYLPYLEKPEITSMIKSRIKQNPAKTMEEMLVGMFHHKLSYIIIKEAELDPYQPAKLMTEKDIEKIADNIKGFKMQISDTNSFENAQVCSGGVPTTEIDEATMESKRSKDLYLTGELVDVDGTCGGYNLQWAWSTGYLAGLHAGKVGKILVDKGKVL